MTDAFLVRSPMPQCYYAIPDSLLLHQFSLICLLSSLPSCDQLTANPDSQVVHLNALIASL